MLRETGKYSFLIFPQIQRIPLEDLTATVSSYTNEHNMRRISQEAEHRKISEGREFFF